MAIQIEKLSPQDWNTYKKIQLEALKENPEAFGSKYADWAYASDEKWQERPSNPETIIMIAKDGEVPIGLVGTHIEEKVGHIWGMFVSKQYRKKGIGKRLLEQLLKQTALEKDIHIFQLSVNPLQEDAISLYQNLHFSIVDRKEWVLGDGKLYNLLVMRKEL